MSSSHLEADFCAFASKLRSRLHRHWSHRFKVRAYRWWNAILTRAHSLALALISIGEATGTSVEPYGHKLSAIGDAFGRNSPEDFVDHGDGGEESVITRINR